MVTNRMANGYHLFLMGDLSLLLLRFVDSHPVLKHTGVTKRAAC